MPKKSSVYQPREDSWLMADQVRVFAKGVVLDMGTGSGIQAETALEKPEVKKVYAVDINPEAVKQCKKRIKKRKLVCLKSDLFSAFKGKLKIQFDVIIFNPPYLPKDKGKSDIALIGGKKGYETIQRFLAEAPKFIKPDGVILLLFSSLTHRHVVEDLIKKNGFKFKQLASSRQFFEELFVYSLVKTDILRKLEPLGYSDIQHFAEGHRGMIYTAKHKGKKVAIKVKNPESRAEGKIQNEAKILQLVNKHGLGPKLVAAKDGYVVYEFVEGTFMKDWLPKAPKSKVKPILKDLLKQGYTLDKLGLSKEEMHRPLKHAIVKNKVVQVDWERTHKSNKPQNVTQLTQFLMVWKDTLKKKGIKIDKKQMIKAAQAYKEKPSDKTFESVVKQLG